jgi:hypothetical protein
VALTISREKSCQIVSEHHFESTASSVLPPVPILYRPALIAQAGKTSFRRKMNLMFLSFFPLLYRAHIIFESHLYRPCRNINPHETCRATGDVSAGVYDEWSVECWTPHGVNNVLPPRCPSRL